MTDNYIQQLQDKGFLQQTEENKKIIHHLTTPCWFKVKENIVKDLKGKYLSTEEIGGVLWAKPTVSNNEITYIIDKVSYVRNAIEDKPRTDKHGKKLTRQNAYLPDEKEISDAFDKIFSDKYLPVKFHTHPTKGHNVLQQITIRQLQTETSEQDKLESENTHPIDNRNLLIPRALIVGNKDISSDIFIGLYNGFICPDNFDDSKRKVQEENMKSIAKSISSIKLTDTQKIFLGIGAVLLLIAIIRYSKYSVPVIFGLAATAPMLLSSTHGIDRPEYFNKLSFGDADIYIPKWDRQNKTQ